MIDEGRLDLTLVVSGGVVVEVQLRSTRPRLAARALAGRSVADALRTAPLLFSLCGNAHGLAVAEAAERAAGRELDPAHRQARAFLAALDMIEGHGWTVLLDWPKLIDEPASASSYAEVRRLTTQLRTALYPDGDAIVLGGGRLAPDHTAIADSVDALEAHLRQEIFGGRALPDGADEFRGWIRRGETSTARFVDQLFVDGFADGDRGEPPVWLIPELDAAWFEARLARDGAFGAAPTFEGKPAEVGPLARMRRDPLVYELVSLWGRGVVARLGARLAEIAELPLRLRELMDDLSPADPGAEVGAATGEGVGLVATSRGPLAYRLVLDDGEVTTAASVAPTEWNFHPEGVLAQTLRGTPVHGAARRAELVVASLDPCVPCSVHVRWPTKPPEDDDA